MIEWLRDNAPWVFSGIGVIALLGLIRLVRYLVQRRAHSPDRAPATLRPDKTDHSAPTQAVGPPPPVNVPNTESPFGMAEKPPAPGRPGPTLDQLTKDIKSAPPFQKRARAEAYLGIAVTWKLALFSAEADGDRIRVTLHAPKTMSVVFCSVNAADYPELRITHRDTAIVLSGEINEVDHQLVTVKVRNARLTIG